MRPNGTYLYYSCLVLTFHWVDLPYSPLGLLCKEQRMDRSRDWDFSDYQVIGHLQGQEEKEGHGDTL